MYVTIILKEKETYQLESWGYGRGLRERLWKGLEREKKGDNSDAILFKSKIYWNINV